MIKNTRIFAFVIALFAFAGFQIAAQQPSPQPQSSREKPPTGSQPKPFVFPKADVFTTANGMKVMLVPYGNVPKVTVQARIRTGHLDETSEQTWLSIIAGGMLKEGTKTRTGEQIANEVAEMGGSLTVGTGDSQVIVGGDVLSEFDAKFVELLADVLTNPVFPAAELERIKTNKLREIAVEKTQPGSIANEKFRQVMFPNHPFGRVYPSDAQLAAYKLDDARNFYNTHFTAKRTVLYVVGVFDAKAVRAAIEKNFQNLKSGAATTVNPPKPTAARSLSVIDRPGAEQSTLYIGLPAVDPSDPDYVPLIVMDSLLSGSFGSRITSNIREQKGYTYSPYSYLWTAYRAGYWLQVADVTTAVTGDSIKEIFFEIDRLRKEPPTQTELDGIKNNIAGLFVIQNSTRRGIINQLDDVEFYGLDKSYIDNYVPKILAVTAADVQKMAQKYLRDDQMTIVVVGDKAKINAQIAAYQK